MKKLLSLTLCSIFSLSVLSGCTKTKPVAELNLYTWDNLFPKEVLDNFTKETGIKINYSTFDSNEAMLAKLESTKGGDYDVVVADDYIIEMAIKEKLAKSLDKTLIPNIKNVNPLYQGHYFDPKDQYSVPYGAGIQTIIYNPDLVKIDITGFDDLLDPSLKNSIGITNNFRVIHGMSLIADGKSVNEENIEAIEKTGKKLLKMAPNIRLIKEENLQDDILSGDISVGLMYTSQVTQACVANPKLKVVYPKEGVGFGIMAQFIPVHAPHEKEAYTFIDYILRPEVSKTCFENVGYYSTNKEADQLIDKKYREFLTLPSSLKIDEMEVMRNISNEAMETHARLWTEFRSACGQ